MEEKSKNLELRGGRHLGGDEGLAASRPGTDVENRRNPERKEPREIRRSEAGFRGTKSA